MFTFGAEKPASQEFKKSRIKELPELVVYRLTYNDDVAAEFLATCSGRVLNS
jgi:hypothetical protein